MIVLCFLADARQVYEFDDTDSGPNARLAGFTGTNAAGSGPHNTGGHMRMHYVKYTYIYCKSVEVFSGFSTSAKTLLVHHNLVWVGCHVGGRIPPQHR